MENLVGRELGLRVLQLPTVLAPPLLYYEWSRGQYDSSMVLSWIARELSDLVGKSYVLGIGDVDAYVRGLNFVFGHADPLAGIAAVYTRRLRPEFYGGEPDLRLYADRVAKEALHEIGHLLGLEHCSDERCVMRFSNSVYEVDSKGSSFCSRCRAELGPAVTGPASAK